MAVACVSGMPGTWVPQVHASCIHNEIAAFKLRSLGSLPKSATYPVGRDFTWTLRRLRGISRRYGGSRWTYLETAQSYSGSMRRRYLEAERSLRLDGPLTKGDARLKAFLKAEKIGAQKDAKPRMIFPRSPRFNLVVASWLKPFEHWLWGYLTARRLFGGSPTRVVAKGLSPRARAGLIQRKMGQFRRGVCFEVDGKAFEAHVTQAQIDAERSVYLSAYHGDRELQSVLARQRFSGVTSSGLKFSRPGGRASGDFNTGMGNSLLMLCAIVGCLRRLVSKFDVLVDGDNALVFCEGVDLDCVLKDFSDLVLHDSGHELAVEKATSTLECVRFGRSAPLFLGHGLGYTMVREPCSVLSGSYASHRWLREPVFARRWAGGVAMCELSLARGVPILQAHALKVLRACGEPDRELPSAALADYFVVGASLVGPSYAVPPTRECRESFHRAFGLTPDEQLAWEAAPVSVGFTYADLRGRWPSEWWEAEPGLFESWLDAAV